jgi:hemolysin activation/secretion protein
MARTPPPRRSPPACTRAFRASLGALCLTGAGVPLAMAIDIPPSVNPGNIERRFEESPPPMPSGHLQAPASAVPALPEDVRKKLAAQLFVLKQVTVEGATVFTPEDLAFAYQDQRDKVISLLDARDIASRITTLYHDKGYLLSQAVVPTQDLANGTLKLRVVEGYISDVVIQGDVRENGYRKLVEAYGDQIKARRPINDSDLERTLLLMNDLPGATASGMLRPSPTQFGAAELVVTFSHKAFEGSYTLDNRGTKYLGPLEHTGSFAANSLFGMYDRTLLRFMTTTPDKEMEYFEVQHVEPVGDHGTRLTLDASHSHTEPGDALAPTEIVGDSDFLQAKLEQPFIRSRQGNLTGRVLFDIRNSDIDVFRTTELNEDKLRVARAGGSYDFTDRLLGIDVIDAQASHGLNILGATSSGTDRTNEHGDGDFTKLNLDLSRTQPLPHDFSLLTSASRQFAFEPLLTAEQFTLGGPSFGQAYDPAELSGDQGLAGKVELRYGQVPNERYLNSYQFFGVYDIGRVWIRGGNPGANDKKSLASAGAGVRASFTQNLSGSLEADVPLTRPASNQGGHGNSPRGFFSMTARF